MDGSKHYRVAPGHTFRGDDGSTKTGGDIIEIGDDLAADHIRAGRIEPEPVAAPDEGAEGAGLGE